MLFRSLLVSSEFSKMVSVLVMQQYVITTAQPAGMAPAQAGPTIADDPVRQYLTNANKRTPTGAGVRGGCF